MYSNSTTTYPLRVNGRIVAVKRGSILDVRRTTGGLLHTPPAIALACDLLNEAKAHGCDEIIVTVTDTKVKYTIPIETFQEKSFPIQRGGYESQRACPLSEFVSMMNIQSKAAVGVTYKATGKKTPKQLSLWGGRNDDDSDR